MSNLVKAAEVIAEAVGDTMLTDVAAKALADAGLLADEYHSIEELYDYRLAYNALEAHGLGGVHRRCHGLTKHRH